MKYILSALGGLVYASLLEYLIHRFILHGVGKKKDSVFSFHWKDHHRAVRKNKGKDPAYEESLFIDNAQSKEVVSLVLLAIAHYPILKANKAFATGAIAGLIAYYFIHKKSHQDVEWAKQYLAWHIEHHLGENQDVNFGVIHPFFDILFGSYKE